MMKVKFEDIEQAFDFVSFGPYGEHSALLDKTTGQIYWHSESGDFDEMPDDIQVSENTIEIPHSKDLGLDNQLAFSFANSHCPDDCGCIREIFSKRGAFARYKGFLESKGLLQKWYDFEQEAREKALREWCKVNGIDLIG